MKGHIANNGDEADGGQPKGQNYTERYMLKRPHTHSHTPHLQGDVITPTYSSKEQLIDSGGKSKTVDSSNFKTI